MGQMVVFQIPVCLVPPPTGREAVLPQDTGNQVSAQSPHLRGLVLSLLQQRPGRWRQGDMSTETQPLLLVPVLDTQDLAVP